MASIDFNPADFCNLFQSDPVKANEIFLTLDNDDFLAIKEHIKSIVDPEARQTIARAVAMQCGGREVARQRVSRRQNQPYYSEERALKLKPLLDRIIADKRDRILYCSDYGVKVTPKTLVLVINQSWQYLIDCLDIDGRYFNLRKEITVKQDVTCVKLQFDKLELDFIDTIDGEYATYKDVRDRIMLFVSEAKPRLKIVLPGDPKVDSTFYTKPFNLTAKEMADIEDILTRFSAVVRATVTSTRILLLKLDPEYEEAMRKKEEREREEREERIREQ